MGEVLVGVLVSLVVSFSLLRFMWEMLDGMIGLVVGS